MAHQQRSDGSDQRWLASLIETFEDVSRTEVRSVPCSHALLRDARAHLAAPKDVPGLRPPKRVRRVA